MLTKCINLKVMSRCKVNLAYKNTKCNINIYGSNRQKFIWNFEIN